MIPVPSDVRVWLSVGRTDMRRGMNGEAVDCCTSTFTVSFWRLPREIGLRRPGDHTGPRVHDFRHRFAIRTLLGWYREGTDVEKRLPALSTYLGHTCVRDTYWYL